MKKSETVFIAQESMNQGKQIVSLLEKFGLFWNVNKINLIADGEPTQFYGTQREDTKNVFACVKNGYHIFEKLSKFDILSSNLFSQFLCIIVICKVSIKFSRITSHMKSSI